MHADMAWMARSADKRSKADLVLPGARSVIILGVNYWPGTATLKSRITNQDKPRWARYALHEDYHDTVRPGLVAAGRLLEKMAGLEERRLSLLCGYGSGAGTGLGCAQRPWFSRQECDVNFKNPWQLAFLPSILTRAEITPDAPLRKSMLPPDEGEKAGLLCGKCTRCLDACPTDAFSSPGIVDARRCISYQTIENKGIIPRELRPGIGARIYGCDICLEVCPWNRFARQGRQLLLATRYGLTDLSLEEILELTPERFAEVFRRTAIKRLKFTGLLRNACVVAGNSGDVQIIAKDQTRWLPTTRRWCALMLCGRCKGWREAQPQLLVSARTQETDAAVLLANMLGN